MHITKYSLENFGIFEGKHIFDFRVTQKKSIQKPIIIFGGRNGSGKTTLFEGIKLCIYGSNFKGYRLPKREYEEYLKNKMHRRLGLSKTEGSSVSLEFEHSHLGEVSKYSIKRCWTGSPVVESLEVLQDDKPVDVVRIVQLQDFLMELIPLGLSKLFFFDGEQIQNLAEDQPDNRHLIDAFNALLGLDIIDHLQTDLRIQKMRKIKETNKDIKLNDDLEVQKKTLEEELRHLEQKRAGKQSEIDNIKAQIEKKEHQLASEGGHFAEKRNEFKAREAILQTQISVLEDKVRDLATSLLPFTIVPILCKSLKERLLFEEKQQQEKAAHELFDEISRQFKQKLNEDEFWDEISLDENSRKLITSRITQELDPLSKSKESGKLVLVHEVSKPELRKLLNWIDLSVESVPNELKSLTVNLENNIRELREVEESLAHVPAEEAIAPIIKQLNNLREELGATTKEKNTFDEKIRLVIFKENEISRNIAKRLEEYERIKSEKESVALGDRVQEILKEFSLKLKKEKLEEVSNRFVDSYNELSNKKNRVDKIKINENDFSIILFRQNGTDLDKNSLSAGEKQIYAIAMLTALARVSGRPIPFIIDTPLARLDIEHRSSLISNFFPKVSHQVIIFSTNTEIDKKYFDQLTPFISRAYLLNYDHKTESSLVSEGYFWSSKRK